jgi:hypothetical protein
MFFGNLRKWHLLSTSPPEESNDNDYYSMDNLNKVKYRSLEDFHVYVLANVLYRPIIVIAMR